MSNTIYENNYNEFIEKHNIDLSRLKRDYITNSLKYGEKPHKEDLEYLYIELNLSVKEIANIFFVGKTKSGIEKYLNFHKIKKPQHLRVNLYKRTCLEKYGVENPTQSEKVKEKTKKTNIERYGGVAPICSDKIKEKTKQTMIERYGVEYAQQSREIQNKLKKNNLEKYGVEYISQLSEVKDKVKQTNKEKYGSEYYTQTDDYKEKAKQTMIERYGVEYAQQSPEIQNTLKKNNLEKYGVEYVSQSPEFKERVKQTNLEKYGVEYASQSSEIKEKVKQTNKEKYGTEYYSQTDEFKERVKETCLKKYGVEHPMHSEEVKKQYKQTCLKKYGVEHISQTDEYKEKYKQTCLERNGVEHPMHCEEIKEKVKQTNLEKYGVEHPFQSEEIKEKYKETCLDRYNSTNYFSSQEYYDNNLEKYGVKHLKQKDIPLTSLEILSDKDKLIKFFEENNTKSRKIVADKLDVAKSVIDTRLRDYNISDDYKLSGTSYYEEEIVNKIREFYDGEVLRNQRILDGKEIDIYIPDYNLGIEFNGDHWHNEAKLIEKGLNPKTYHYEKSMVARGLGIFLLHIFEYEYNRSKDKYIGYIKQLMGMAEKLPLNDCEIKQVDALYYTKFIEDYSLQEVDNSDIRLGLYYKDELVEVISFNELDNNEYELVNHTMKQGINVINGINKLFNYFINNYNPFKVIGYNNIHNQRPDIYNQINFKHSHTTKPNCVYVNNNKLYDCGKDVYIWNKD